jgi:soluble lytic murein transglycosylase-like protein
MPPSSDLLALARAAAAYHELDFTFTVSSVVYTGTALVCAVIEQESSWNTHAIRYEPGFRTRYVAPLGLPPTEEIARSISWGLMQVMGQVAREHGFDGKFLSGLCDPALGLDIGCRVLAHKIASAHGDIAAALALWNGGANPEYPQQVLQKLPAYERVPPRAPPA